MAKYVLVGGRGGWCVLKTDSEMAGNESSETLVGKLQLTDDKIAELNAMLQSYPKMTQLLVELSFQFGRNFDHLKLLQKEQQTTDPKKLN